MKHLQLTILTAFLLLPLGAWAQTQDSLRDVSNALRQAKTTHHLEDLEKAKYSLQNVLSVHNTPGSREALEKVNQAIVALRTQKPTEADKFADEALQAMARVAKETNQHK
ncbi:MAG: hypothetical protein QOE70_1630 [Chthoniobacter sp.]|jgi:hypothetical protein|nr:hypothetical protein [Chthoniobacter sp.]